MGSTSDLQIQQSACQDLLTKDGTHSGCLRGKTILHTWGDNLDQKIKKPGFAQKITSVISWQRLFVVVYEGYFIIYNSETSKKPAKVIDLSGFQRVEKEEYLKIKDVPWPFKVSSELHSKVMYYGAISEPELKNWIEAVTKGIDDAKLSGRKPVIYDQKKETTPKPKPKRDKPLPRTPSLHPTPSVDDEDDDDPQDDYDYIPDPIEDMRENVKPSPTPSRSKLPPLPSVPSSSSGTGREVEYEVHSPRLLHPPVEAKPSAAKSRKELAVPPTPVEDLSTPKGILKKTPPPVPSQVVRPMPAPKKPPAVPPNLAKKPIPEVAVGKKSDGDADDNVEYEFTADDRLVIDATWTGSSDESTELMKSMKEEGVYMIRESTTGNGDQTLQVVSDGAVRKYKISKEGKQFQMASGSTFDSMAELLKFYQKNSIPNHSTKLTKPYYRI